MILPALGHGSGLYSYWLVSSEGSVDSSESVSGSSGSVGAGSGSAGAVGAGAGSAVGGRLRLGHLLA